MSEALLTDAVLHDRRSAFRSIAGDNYAARIDPIKEQLRAATLDGGTLRDAHARLVAEKSKGEWHAIDEMAWASALLDCMEAAAVPVEEKLAAAEAAAPVKGKKERKGRKAAKPKAPTVAWAHKIGRSGTRIKGNVTTFEMLKATLDGGAWQSRSVPDERHVGWCLASCALDADFADEAKWKFGDYAVFGWRVDRRKVHSGTLAMETEAALRREEKNAGRTLGKKFRKQIKDEVRRTLLEEATAETTVYTVVMVPSEGWALVDGPPQVVEEVRARLGGVVQGLSGALQPVIRSRLAAATGERFRTDLRVAHHDAAPEDGEETADIPSGILSDFLLWLATPGTSRRSRAWEFEERVTWKIAGGPIKIRVPVENTGNDITLEDADSAALVSSLAEGGRFQAVRLAVEERQEVEVPADSDAPTPSAIIHTYHLSLEVIPGSKTRKSGIRIHSMGLPTLKGGDSAAALIFERVELHKKLWSFVEALFRAFASDRCQDWQPVIDAARQWVGLELTRRFVFDERTGQGWLFPPVAERVLAIEDKNAEKPKGRGRGKAK